VITTPAKKPNGSLSSLLRESKRAAAGRWPEILAALGGIPSDILDGNHHPCPKCGGTDRFRLIDDAAGSLYCNKCFCGKNGDGYAALQWLCGWTFPETIKAVASHLGVTGHANGNGKPEIVTTYDYRDATGDLVFQVCRLDPKSFRQRRPKFDGGWEWNTKGCPKLLYRLPELLAKPDAVVYVAEGEKDCDNLFKLGLTATCNAMGAGKWRKEHAERLRGRAVVVLPDNDQPGQEHARQVLESLQRVAAKVAVVELPGLPEKGDVSDWLAAGHTVDEMQALATAALNTAEQAEPPLFCQVLSNREFLEASYDLRHLVKDCLIQGQPGVVGGRSKCCKTLVALDLALSVASGTPFLGHFEVPQPENVGFFSFESGPATLQLNFYRMALARGLSPDDIFDLPIFWQHEHRPCLSDASHIGALGELVAKHDLRLLVVDPLYLTLFGPDDAPKSGDLFFMGQRLAGLGDLSLATGATVLVLHHFRKSAIQDNDEPAGLEELSMSGVGEFVRQWILLQRRETYANDGTHQLWARIGGSAGHSGLYGLTITESDSQGRPWSTSVERVQDVRQEIKATRESRRAADREKKDDENRRRLLEVMERFPQGETQRTLRAAAGLSGDSFSKAILSLLEEGLAIVCEVEKGRRTLEGYRPCKP